MSKINERLKDERVRLGMSQAAFAQKAGVHRNTQIKYESGERYPDSEYIHSIGEIGVDVFYIFSGFKSEDQDLHDIAQFELREGIYAALGISFQETHNLVLEMMHLANKEVDEGGAWDTESWFHKRDEFVLKVLSSHHIARENSQRLDTADVQLLSSVIIGFETALAKLNRALPPEKKASALIMLYRAAKTGGNVDQQMIEETIALAE